MTEAVAPPVLELDRALAAPPERVFRAWTDPDELARWFCPNPDLPTTAEVDLRVGGAYRIRMGTFEVAGAYRTIDPPRTLAFTWGWTRSLERLVAAMAPRAEGGGDGAA